MVQGEAPAVLTLGVDVCGVGGEADVRGHLEDLPALPAHHHAAPADPLLRGEDDAVPADEADGRGPLQIAIAHLSFTFQHVIREARY